jgi:hypothetical protein
MYLNLFLTFVGLIASVHLICTAARLSTRVPWTIVAEISTGFGAAVGLTVTAIHADHSRALMFMGALTCALVSFSVEKALRKESRIFASKPVPWMKARPERKHMAAEGPHTAFAFMGSSSEEHVTGNGEGDDNGGEQ